MVEFLVKRHRYGVIVGRQAWGWCSSWLGGMGMVWLLVKRHRYGVIVGKQSWGWCSDALEAAGWGGGG